MRVTVKHDGCRRELPEEFSRKLKDYNEAHGSPRIRVVWNPRARRIGDKEFDPRWEVWIELMDNQLMGKEQLNSKDRFEDGRFWRFLQTWQYPDGSFLPLDDRFFQALRVADTWAKRDDYYERYVRPQEKLEEEGWRDLKNAAEGVTSYWKDWANTMVGAATGGDWRAKEWWK